MKIFEYSEDKKNFYLITEFMDGGELFDFITQKKNFNEKEAYLIFE